MSIRRLPQLQLRPSKRTLFGLAIIFPLLLVLDYFFLLGFAKQQFSHDLNSRLSAIQSDISFSGTSAQWDVSKLYNDTLGPEPYVILANNSLMVDHGNLPAHFFTDIDTTAFASQSSPVTVATDAGSRWRLLVKPVNKNNETAGHIAVGVELGTAVAVPNGIDDILNQAVTQIAGELTLDQYGQLSTDNLRVRDVHPLISAFGVVRADGQLLPVTLGAYPFTAKGTAIDAAKQHIGTTSVVHPDSLNFSYLVRAVELKDNAGQTRGVAVVAASFRETQLLLQAQVNVVGVLLALFAITLVYFSAPRFMLRRGTMPIERALRLGEGERIEFKEILPAGNSLAKHIAGFANTGGGAVFIGIKDDGSAVGLEATVDNNRKQHPGQAGDRTQKGLQNFDQIERHIVNDLRNLISPPPDVALTKEKFQGKTILRIAVSEARRMVYTVGGVIFVRQGNQTVPAKAEEILRIVRSRT